MRRKRLDDLTGSAPRMPEGARAEIEALRTSERMQRIFAAAPGRGEPSGPAGTGSIGTRHGMAASGPGVEGDEESGTSRRGLFGSRRARVLAGLTPVYLAVAVIAAEGLTGGLTGRGTGDDAELSDAGPEKTIRYAAEARQGGGPQDGAAAANGAPKAGVETAAAGDGDLERGPTASGQGEAVGKAGAGADRDDGAAAGDGDREQGPIASGQGEAVGKAGAGADRADGAAAGAAGARVAKAASGGARARAAVQKTGDDLAKDGRPATEDAVALAPETQARWQGAGEGAEQGPATARGPGSAAAGAAEPELAAEAGSATMPQATWSQTTSPAPAPPPRESAAPSGGPAGAAPARQVGETQEAGARIVLHYGGERGGAAARKLAEELRASGFARTELRRVPFAVSRANVRYFHDRNLGVAREVNAILRAAGGRSELRDFTHYAPSPSVGTVEVWLPG